VELALSRGEQTVFTLSMGLAFRGLHFFTLAGGFHLGALHKVETGMFKVIVSYLSFYAATNL